MISGVPFPSFLPAAVNHLLAAEPWAQRLLAAHAGRVAAVDAGIASVRLRITPHGMVETAPDGEAAAVTLHVRPADLPLLLRHRDQAFSYVRIDGDAGFASAISQVAQSLRWDAEEDLARWIGDIAAVRVAGGARAALSAARAGQRALAENLAEFLADERPVLMRPAAVETFRRDVARLRDDVERLSKRVDRLRKAAAR
ncbi:MAG: ubiquinone biosynthesis accessory factor UbiJ [Burkholderiaceae bacterium]